MLAGLAGLCVGTAPAAASDEDRALPLPALGSRILLPEVALFDGTTFRPAQAQGRIVVLYWWASWCPFCAQTTPWIDKFWQAHLDRDLHVLGLSIDRKADDAIAYLARRGYRFPAGLATPEVTRVLPKPKGLPVTLVLGRDARVLAAEAGQLFPEDVAQFDRFL